MLDQFTTPFFSLLQLTDKKIQENQNNPKELSSWLKSLDLLIKIFYDLNSQDIPEFFEDNMSPLFEIIFKYLSYSNPSLSTDDDDEAGPLEKAKSSICELLKLYTIKYEEEFQSLLPKFVEATWTLLTTTGVQPKYDILISKALSFLTSVAANVRHAPMFASDEILQNIVRSVILPNVTLQESDEEMFEDDPIEFIRRDLEGSDSDTKRRAATDFLRELNNKNETAVTGVVMTYVKQFLSNYGSDNSQWKQKDTAIYLFSAIAVKGAITSTGVTSTNPLVDVIGFFSESILRDLLDPNANPILKVDSIKYIHTFRNQLSKEQLINSFLQLATLLLSEEYVVYTYAAITIEKILIMRKAADDKTPTFSKEDIAPAAKDLLSNLFKLILRGTTPEKLAENEFLMKCVFRILTTAKETTAPYALELLTQVIAILGEISKNPSNPRFSHYTFEVIGGIIKYAAPTVGVTAIENLIFPPFMQLLSQDVSEYVPYTFQLLAELLHFYPNDQGLSQNYTQLIKPLLAPVVWELRGNIPGLVSLLQSILRHGSNTVIETGNLQAFLGVFQKLIASKANEAYGLALLQDIFYNIPPSYLEPYLKQIGILLMTRLSKSVTDRFVSQLALTVYFVAAAQRDGLGPDYIIKIFDSAQGNIFGSIFSKFILPSTTKIVSLRERKIAAVGLTKILTESQAFVSGAYNSNWTEGLVILVDLLKTDLAAPMDDEFLQDVDTEESLSFGSNYSQLSTAVIPPINPALALTTDPKSFFIAQIKKVDALVNGQLGALIASLPNNVKEDLQSIGFQ